MGSEEADMDSAGTCASGGDAEDSAPASGTAALKPLTAQFDPEQHQPYLDRLLAAVGKNADKSVRNVALTGRYGAGKSSVLAKLRETLPDRVLTLSMSTLGIPTAAADKAAGGYISPASGDGDESDERVDTQTNQIEKELVKQLLHREPPRRLPLSRYRRISAPGLGRAAITAAIQVGVVAIALGLLGWMPAIVGAGTGHAARGAFTKVGAFATATIVLTWVRLVIYDKAISAISAGGASISLSKKDDSYFDKYLDEIVYYFTRVSTVDIVVFEDLDRFDNPEIFEELRELNGLLNNSKQIGRTIRFIYALKDSIFESPVIRPAEDRDLASEGAGPLKAGPDEDAARREVTRANRTKFFDLVIPIVPFITPRSSRNLLRRLLSEGGIPRVSPEVRDLVAKHLTDMRLLINIRNEFVVFADRLITNKAGVPGLDPDKLFALVVYKNVALSDYEDLLLGRSKLDTLYRDSRRIVTTSIDAISDRLRDIDNSLALRQALTRRAETWGERLGRLLVLIAESQYPSATLKLETVQLTELDGDAPNPGIYDEGRWKTDAFWRELVKRKGSVTGTLTSETVGNVVASISFDWISEQVSDSVRFADWNDRPEDEVARERARLDKDLDLLRRADFSDLTAREDFTARVLELSSDASDKEDKNQDARPEVETFEQMLRRTVTAELSRDLIARGFIDQNFTVYISQFYDDLVSVSAMRFVFQHVQRDLPDFDFDLPGDDDVRGVLAETNSDFLDQASAYNISVLDYLLRNDEEAAAKVLARVQRVSGDLDLAFLDAVLRRGRQALDAVRVLTATWPAMFTYLVDGADLDTNRRVVMVDEALKHASDDVEYDLDERVQAFFRDTSAQLPVITGRAVALPRSTPENDDEPKHSDSAERVGSATDIGELGKDVDEVVDESDRLPDEAMPTSGVLEYSEPDALKAVRLLERAGFRCGDLRKVRPEVRALLVARDLYVLDGPNLHAALGDSELQGEAVDTSEQQEPDPEPNGTGEDDVSASDGSVPVPAPTAEPLTLDRLRAENREVFDDCVANPDGYLEAAGRGMSTAAFISNADELLSVLEEIQGWDLEQLTTVMTTLPDNWSLHRLTEAPPSTWRALARCRRFEATLENFTRYVEEAGTIDTDLGGLLADAGTFSEARPDAGDGDAKGEDVQTAADPVKAALLVLNAEEAIEETRVRVALSASLSPGALDVAGIAPDQAVLLGPLLREHLVADSVEAFDHFASSATDAALLDAIKSSRGFATFATAAVLEGHVAAVLGDDEIDKALHERILGDLPGFLPASDPDDLRAALQRAADADITVPIAELNRVAVTTGDAPLVCDYLNKLADTITAGDSRDVLASLGPPYADLLTPGASFELQKNDQLRTTLQRLVDESMIEVDDGRRGAEGMTVTVRQ